MDHLIAPFLSQETTVALSVSWLFTWPSGYKLIQRTCTVFAIPVSEEVNFDARKAHIEVNMLALKLPQNLPSILQTCRDRLNKIAYLEINLVSL